jgi:uncharacterized protein YecT (DUF1311 family)
MPDVDLSSLSGTELRRLLDSSRARGQASLSYQVLKEMAERRERGGRKPRRGGGAHVVSLDLGERLEADDGDVAVAEREAEPPPQTLADPPGGAQPEPDEAAPLYLQPEPPPAVRTTRRERGPGGRWPTVGFLAGLALGAGLGWGGDELMRQRQLDANATAAVAASDAALKAQPVDTPAVAPPAPPPAIAETAPAAPAAPEASSAPTATPPPPQAVAPQPAIPAPPPAPVVAERTPIPEGPAAELPAVDSASGACAQAATPADRTICGDPELQRLQRELREAYAKALDAHQDRALLREHQLAWRDARSNISDPARLTQLYEARIRTLKSATAAARAAH